MPDMYVIMGDRNTRKSATIRALTGAFKRGPHQVATRNAGVTDIFVQISKKIFVKKILKMNIRL